MNEQDVQKDEPKREHILVCLSSAPSNIKVIKTAAKMAVAFNAEFTALYIETPNHSNMPENDKITVKENMDLAQKFGAEIEIVCGDDIPFQIAEFSRLSGVTQIVVGTTVTGKLPSLRKHSIAEKLITLSPDVDIHIIPDSDVVMRRFKSQRKTEKHFYFSVRDFIISLVALVLSTLLGYFFMYLGFTEANIITVYILGVLFTSMLTTHRGYSLVSSVVSVLVFNFFFTAPHFTLKAHDQGYIATFFIMFIAAFVTGGLAMRLKHTAKMSVLSAYRTKILFDTNQLLQKADGKDGIILATAKQLIKLLGRNIAIYSIDDEKIDTNIFYVKENNKSTKLLGKRELEIAKWTMDNNHRAGYNTENFCESDSLFLAIRVNQNVYGSVGIEINDSPIDSFEYSVLLSILGECALALENYTNAKEREKAAVLAKHEQLRADLLRTISHDLRTPLTTISGNADNLLSNGALFSEDTKKQIYKDIYSEAVWLASLVENLLSVTRIEDGKMELNITTELVDEIISEALNHVNRKAHKHNIIIKSNDELILAKVDAKLIVQVVINIVDNAIKYTDENSHIIIETLVEGDKVVVKIKDDGPGISNEDKNHIFDMFYTTRNKIADSHRSLGLGLALCKSIINAHGGEIFVTDNEPKGTVFTFSLPREEVKMNE